MYSILTSFTLCLILSYASHACDRGIRGWSSANPIIPQVKLSQETQCFGFIKDEEKMILSLLKDCHLAGDDVSLDRQTSIENMAEKRGSYSIFMYDVRLSAQSSFDHQPHELIIKGIRNFKKLYDRKNHSPVLELQNYAYLRQTNVGIFNQAKSTYAPTLVLDLTSFWYFDPLTNEKQYVSVLPKKFGKSINDIFFENQYQINDEMRTVFGKVGRALGELHYGLARDEMKEAVIKGNFDDYVTTNHHDFHGGNILYDDLYDDISFVDLSTMAETHRVNVPFWHDIFYFYYLTKYRSWDAHKVDHFNDLMDQFVYGYCQSVPTVAQDDLKDYIYDLIQVWTKIYIVHLGLPLKELEDHGDDYHKPENLAKYILKKKIKKSTDLLEKK